MYITQNLEQCQMERGQFQNREMKTIRISSRYLTDFSYMQYACLSAVLGS